jgi:hypothetical protein
MEAHTVIGHSKEGPRRRTRPVPGRGRPVNNRKQVSVRQVIRRLAARVGISVTPSRPPGRHTAAHLAGRPPLVRPTQVAPYDHDGEPFVVRPYVLAHEERVRERRRRLRSNLTLATAGIYLTVGVAAL